MSKYVMPPPKASVDVRPGTLTWQFHKVDISDGGKYAILLGGNGGLLLSINPIRI
jgi:hypothetical protein